ncbi:MAG: hypothetical protein JWN86_4194 [Planctomycetota bacterium]|nr:hypothetical protein [Planctomycetota bacterium]
MVGTFSCARCARPNHPSTAFCAGCGLPLGTAQADAGAARDALGVYEAPDPSEADLSPVVRDLALRCGFPATPFGHGWRVVVPLPMDRTQAVYLGHDGTDAEGRPLIGLVSVCGPANDRDTRLLLKLNARAVEGHFAIETLRGDEYFVVCRAILAESAGEIDAPGLVARIAQVADGLEDRLSRGRDLY